MNDYEKQFEQIVAGLNIDDRPDTEHKKALRHQILTARQKGSSDKTTPRIQPAWSKIMKSNITKSAAAAVITIAVLIGINMLNGTPAWADVLNEIVIAKTAMFELIIEKDGQIIQISQLTCKSPGLIKQVMSDGEVHIVNFEEHSMLVLNPDTQKAWLQELTEDSVELSQLDVFSNYQKRLEKMIHYPDKTVENLGYRTIDGQKVIGFRTQLTELDKVIGWQGKGTFTVWSNIATKLPIRMEWYDEMFGINTIADHLQLNMELNDSVFEMKAPDGYKIETVQQKATQDEEPGNPTSVNEEKIVEGFRSWILLSGGVFPSSMTMDAIKDLDPDASVVLKQVGWGFQLTLSKNIDLGRERFGFSKKNPPSEEEKAELNKKLGVALNNALNGFIAVFQLPAECDWHYAGKDVMMGDADTAIFWYRPKDSTNYRIIYGDLTVEDIALENLSE